MMPDYNFYIHDNTADGALSRPGGIQTSAPDSNMVLDSLGGSGGINTAGAGRRALSGVENFALSPLNQATGGLASPSYNLAKNAITGGAVGGAAVGLAIAAINLAVREIQKRIAENEAKAEAANNRDNLLLRSGRVTQATHYTSSVFGVKSTTRN